MACTSRLLSSRAAEAVDEPKEAAPRCSPRMRRPSFRYCSMGSHSRSRKPWTTGVGSLGVGVREVQVPCPAYLLPLLPGTVPGTAALCPPPPSGPLTELNNRVHGAHAPQQAGQLVLANVLQPLIEGITQHLVHTQKPRGEERGGGNDQEAQEPLWQEQWASCWACPAVCRAEGVP